MNSNPEQPRTFVDKNNKHLEGRLALERYYQRRDITDFGQTKPAKQFQPRQHN